MPRPRTSKKTTDITNSPEFQEFVNSADQVKEASPTVTATGDSNSKWEERAASGRRIHNYKLSYNDSQKALLEAAKKETNLPFSRLIGDAVWEILETRYGHLVPIEKGR